MVINNNGEKIIVLAEKEDGKTAYFTYELLRAGKELADKMGTKLCIVVAGNNVGTISNEMAYFSAEVYMLDHPLLENFQADIYANAMVQCFKSMNPDTIILGHTLDNIDLASKVACRIGAQVLTDITHLDRGTDNNELLCEKPIYGDKAIATFTMGRSPRMVTLRPKIMAALEKGSGKGTIIPFPLALDRSMAKTEFVESIPGESVSLDKADAIVAGGRGIKEVEGIKYLKDLAQTLKRFYGAVELGASRPLVDNGFFPPSRQIGLTGEKVAPELYFAIAISGASQHLSGITGSKKIVAINKDEQASIFESADYGVVGDYEKVIPALARKLKELP